MDDMSQYMQQMNAAAASQSLSDASVAAQNAKEQAKTEYQRFKQGVVEGVSGPLGVDLLEKAVEKGGLKVAEKVGLGNAFKDWQEGGKGVQGLANAARGAIGRATGKAVPEATATTPAPAPATAPAPAPATAPTASTATTAPLDAEIAAKTTARDAAKTTLDSTRGSLQSANKTLKLAQDVSDAAKTDLAAKESIAEARRVKGVQQAGGAVSKTEQDASTAARVAVNDARDVALRTQNLANEAAVKQGKLAALETQHTADLDTAENSLQATRDASAGASSAGGAGGGAAEPGDDFEMVEPLSEEEAAKAAAAVSDVGKGESTLAKLTAVSAEDDFNPAGLVITAGLAIGTLFAGIFGHHRDGLPKHPPVPPPVMNASTQFGVAQ